MVASAPTAVANPIRLKTGIHQDVTLGISSSVAAETLNHQKQNSVLKKENKKN